MKISLNGKDVDTDVALPLQLRDLRKLKKEYGIEFGTTNTLEDIEKQAGFLLVILKKANPDLTEADVDDLTLVQMHALIKAVVETSQAPDVPS